MKNFAACATVSLLLGILSGPALLTEAGVDKIVVTEGDINFKVKRYDDGRNNPYKISFWTKYLEIGGAKFSFDPEGAVRTFAAGFEEQYGVKYKDDGTLNKVTLKNGGWPAIRALLEPDENGFEKNDVHAQGAADERVVQSDKHRRLYACDECEEIWDLLCGTGLATVCNLVGNDVIEIDGTGAVDILCEDFGKVCSYLSAEAACDGQCIDSDGDTPLETPAPAMPFPTPALTPEPTTAPILEPTSWPTTMIIPAPPTYTT